MRPLTLFVITLASVAAAAARAAEAPATTIDSVSAESVSTDAETTTTFHDEVVATGNDLTLTCDFLKVIATRVGEKSATLGKYGKFKYLLATGHVRIVQGDRVATCGRARFSPAKTESFSPRTRWSRSRPSTTRRAAREWCSTAARGAP